VAAALVDEDSVCSNLGGESQRGEFTRIQSHGILQQGGIVFAICCRIPSGKDNPRT